MMKVTDSSSSRFTERQRKKRPGSCGFPAVFWEFVPDLWSIEPERCLCMFSSDSGDRQQTLPTRSEKVWMIRSGAEDQKCILALNRSVLCKPTVVS